MTAAGTGTCDGCDREGPVQQLEEVFLPSGAMTVCPECRYHAEALAERSTAECEGCGDAVTAATLARTELPDGVDVILCPDCRRSVSAGEYPGGTDAANATAAADEATRSSGNSTRSSGDAEHSSGEPIQSSEEPAQSSGEPAQSSGDAVADGATDKPATTRNACDQCGNLFSIELYQVTTVDGRTEQFCPDCKDDGIESGIVRDVELRRAQAYEVLGIGGSASGQEIREAYLDQVKEVHPDRADGSRSEFMLVQQAYERLRED